MLGYLEGEVILKKESFIILKLNGIGYEVFLPQKTLKSIEIDQTLKIFSYLDVGERSLKLYGFLTYEELELFALFRNISGIGPRAALAAASIGPPDEVKKQIQQGNEKILKDIPGIGPKKSKKIILELSGKFKSLEPKAKKEKKDDFSRDEACLALVNLGFQKDAAKAALTQVSDSIKGTQERVKEALKFLQK